jgi:SAM-dependent methyltransferase
LKKLKVLVPKPLRNWLNYRRQDAQKVTRRTMLAFDRVTNWSQLRKVQPHRRDFGLGRGKSIDEFYIKNFLAAYKEDIRGRVAEIGWDDYTKLFGGEQVERVDILDINERNEKRTITIDLTQTARASDKVFDCIICTQTLFEIYDYASTVRSLHKMLKPDGVVLVTVPGISQSVRGRALGGAGDDYWRFTGRSARLIFGEVFGAENVVVHTYGNVLTATGLLHGLVQEELTQEELEYNDPDYEVTIGLKATKRVTT